MSKLISKKSIVKYLTELSIIVFGITIAFFVDDWAENRREHKYETELLENIREELYLNFNRFQDWNHYYQEINALFEEFYEIQLIDDSSRSAAIKYKDILLNRVSSKTHKSLI